jgi:hypothetical protein
MTGTKPDGLASLTPWGYAMPITAVNVLNNNDFPLVDGFDGVFYRFEPGRAITIPVEAAKHILGWDERAPGSISFRPISSLMPRIFMRRRKPWRDF